MPGHIDVVPPGVQLLQVGGFEFAESHMQGFAADHREHESTGWERAAKGAKGSWLSR
jgi:hypothetical protein